QVDQLFELAALGVAQLLGSREIVRGLDGDRHFTELELHALRERAQCDGHSLFQRRRVDGERCDGIHQALAIVCVRRIFCCSWMIPYSRASAVGGQTGTYTSTGTMRSQP